MHHRRYTSSKHHKLGQFLATAICGNDILSSTLYVSGIAALYAGVFAPLVLVAVGVVLLLYRSVYREVVEALPVNGGAYNALLNSTSKIAASVAGTMMLLSAIATAVISAKTAIEYAFYTVGQVAAQFTSAITADILERYAIPGALLILFLFALLVILGVKSSAKVAAVIFSVHVATLISFLVIGGLYAWQHPGSLAALANIHSTFATIAENGGLVHTLLFGFAISLLGISGFESSADFVEEQAPGVFAKTLRNMALSVIIFNPLIAIVAVAVVPLSVVATAKDFILAVAAGAIGGMPLLVLVGVDAFLVLCGAVLSSFISMNSLMKRMSQDNVLPASLTAKPSRFGSYPRINVLFVILCGSILLLTRGDLLSLAQVYTVSFLGVMTLFAVGNLVLRQTRPTLKRPYTAPTIIVIMAMLSTMIGLLINVDINPGNVMYFLLYFIPAILVVFSMLFKQDFYASLVRIFTVVPIAPFRRYFEARYDEVRHKHYYVFIHHVFNVFPALNYIDNNEGGRTVTLVHCRGSSEQRLAIKNVLPRLKEAGVFPYMNIEFKYLPKLFSPATVTGFAAENGVPVNNIFIGSIHLSHDFDYEQFGGVRIILE